MNREVLREQRLKIATQALNGTIMVALEKAKKSNVMASANDIAKAAIEIADALIEATK